MTRECFICRRKYVVGEILSLHRVPKDFQTKKKWLSFMGIDIHGTCDLSIYTYICANHFSPEDFYITPSGKRCLKKGTVPRRVTTAIVKELGPRPSRQRFPKDLKCHRQRIWIKSLAISSDLPKYPYICSDHFVKSDFTVKPSGMRYFLIKDAVPLRLYESPSLLNIIVVGVFVRMKCFIFVELYLWICSNLIYRKLDEIATLI